MAPAGRKPTVDADVLCAEIWTYPAPAVTAKMLADEVDMSRQGMHKRLKELEEQGLVQTYKGGGTRLWWLTKNGHTLAREAVSLD